MSRTLTLRPARMRWALHVFAIGLAGLSFECSAPKTLTILHTNDMHAAFLPHEATWVRSTPKPLVGGFEELGWRIDSIRQVKPSTILLDAGDVMTGTPMSDVKYKDVDGGALFEMMNKLRYDAWTFGNHDLDISQENLKGLIGIATFPTVSANLVDSSGAFIFRNKEYAIVQRGGMSIGIIGLMSEDLFHLTNTNNLRGLKVLPVVATAQRIIDEIDPTTDLIIALTHEGADEDSVLAASTHGLDIIIGGHSHTRLVTPKKVNNVLICQAGSSCENLGVVDVTVEDDRVVQSEGTLVQLWVGEQHPHSEVSDLVDEYRKKIESDFGVVVATLSEDWKRARGNETPLGNFIVDAIREGADADVAVTNTSGIRKDLTQGAVTKLDLFEVSPFRNMLVTFPVKGSVLRTFIEAQARARAINRANVEVSGIQCAWKRDGERVNVEMILVRGAPLDDSKTYTMATSDFVINQADRYLGLEPSNVRYTSTTIFEALVDKARRDKKLMQAAPGRFVEQP